MTKQGRQAVADAEEDAFWSLFMGSPKAYGTNLSPISAALTMTAYALSTQHGRRRLR